MSADLEGPTRYRGEAIDLIKAFTPFSEDEIQRLRLFSQHVSDIDELDLPQRPKLTLLLAGAPQVENISRDPVYALVIAYRKLVLQSDPANFNRIRNLIGQHAEQAGTEDSATVHVWLKNIKDHREGVRQGPGPPSSDQDERRVLRPYEVIDWLVNGVVAHSDSEPRRYWEALGGWDNHAMLFLALGAIAEDLKAVRGVDSMVRGILATPDLHADG